MSWLAAVGMVLVLAAGAAAPGRVAAGLEDDLAGRLGGGATLHVTVEADPFLELPRGHLAAVRIEAHDLPFGPVRWPSLKLAARDVRVPGPALLRLAPPLLLAPAPARLELAASQEALTREAARLAAEGLFTNLPVPSGPARVMLGERVTLEGVAITCSPGRVGVEAKLTPARGRSRALALSFAPTCPDGRRVRATDLQLAVDGRPLPPPLTRLAAGTLPPLVDLEAWPALGPGWRIDRLGVATAGLTIEASGQLDGAPR